MASLFGFGVIDPQNMREAWRDARGEVILKTMTDATQPFIEQVIKKRLQRRGIIKE